MNQVEADGVRFPELTPNQRDHLKAHLQDVPPFRALIRSIECRLFENCGPLTQPVLDLGCGDGHFVTATFSGQVLVGVDPDLGSAAKAKTRGAYFLTVCASATRLPFKPDSFQTVISNCVLEHIPDVETAISESVRVLSPSGRFIFGVPCDRFGELLLGSTIARSLGLSGLAHGYENWFNRHSKHFHTDSPDIWLGRLHNHGFSVRWWTYYMTPRAHLVFDLLHYLSLPYLICYKLTGRWVFARPVFTKVFERWLRPLVRSSPCDSGAYLFFDAIRASQEPDDG